MEAIIRCVNMKWMTILVGPPCSGKSTLVKNLATLTGHRLLEFPMNSDTDTIDLLGGYEQVIDTDLEQFLLGFREASWSHSNHMKCWHGILHNLSDIIVPQPGLFENVSRSIT